MVCVGCGESPGVPLHPFESGSPICGWCLRLSRQRDDVRSSRTASKNFSKKFKKPIDKPHKMWYNKDTNEGSKAEAEGKTHESRVSP